MRSEVDCRGEFLCVGIQQEGAHLLSERRAFDDCDQGISLPDGLLGEVYGHPQATVRRK